MLRFLTSRSFRRIENSIVTTYKEETKLSGHFNLALLSKQCWRLINEPESLWARVLKARYYPNCSFLEASKGYRASWSWSSLLEARDTMIKGTSWQVISGSSINIWKDNWLPPPHSGVIKTSGITQVAAPVLVGSLIDWDTHSWVLDSILHLIQPSEINKIRSIPIGDGEGQDRLIWPWNKDVQFTVRLGYHGIHSKLTIFHPPNCGSSHVVDTKAWKLIWKIETLPKIKNFLWKVLNGAAPTMANLYRRKLAPSPLCPIYGVEEETFEHLLLICPWVEGVWFGSPLGIRIDKQKTTTFDLWLYNLSIKLSSTREQKKSLTMISCICWGIWKSRCAFVYEHKSISLSFTISSGANLALEYQAAKSQVPAPPRSIDATAIPRWKPPSPNMAKVNCDASWSSPNSSGLGVVIRDSNEDLICGLASFTRCDTVAIAESEAILAGINLAISWNLKRVIVESDSNEIIKELRNSKSCRNWRIYPIIEQIRRRATLFDDCVWDWVPREANKAAYAAASLAIRSVGLLRWANQLPPSLTLVLRNDGLPCPHDEAL